MLLHCKGQLLSSLIFTFATAVVISEARTAGKKVADATQSTQPTGGQGSQSDVRRPHQDTIYGEDNCKSDKLRELILETIGLFPHQYSYQARYMKQQAEDRFGNWWSAVIISEKGGYGMSAVYDQYTNTTCELRIFDTFYWLGRTS